MGFQEAVTKLNEMKKIGLIQDYAIGGGYAVNLYDVPQATYDLDVYVISSPENDLSKLYDHFRKDGSIIKNEHIFIGDMPVQFFPNLGPLYNNAVEEARTIEFNDISARFVDIEHLIVLLLTAFRAKDKIRIKGLLDKANNDVLLRLIERFDDKKDTLSERYRKILEETD